MNSVRLLPLAGLDDSIPAIIAVIFFFMIPIVGILAWHQQKMAKYMQGGHVELPPIPNNNLSETSGLRQDVQQLKDVVANLAMAVDTMNTRMNSQADIQDRVKTGDRP